MITESIELLGKGLYKNIPDTLTLKSLPGTSELDYVGAEDFVETMLSTIFPQAIVEDINFRSLLEIDFYWICRCMRLMNYGPYHTTNAIYCTKCNTVNRGEYIVDLRTVGCKMLPDKFKNDLKLTKDDFIDFSKEVVIALPTINAVVESSKDKMFVGKDGKVNQAYARVCYMIKSIGGKAVTPIEAKLTIEQDMSPADVKILMELADEITDYGLRAGGSTTCPKCGSKQATFVALVDDRFLRPTLGDLRRWKADRRAGSEENVSGSKTDDV